MPPHGRHCRIDMFVAAGYPSEAGTHDSAKSFTSRVAKNEPRGRVSKVYVPAFFVFLFIILSSKLNWGAH